MPDVEVRIRDDVPLPVIVSNKSAFKIMGCDRGKDPGGGGGRSLIEFSGRPCSKTRLTSADRDAAPMATTALDVLSQDPETLDQRLAGVWRRRPASDPTSRDCVGVSTCTPSGGGHAHVPSKTRHCAIVSSMLGRLIQQ